ncbi:Nucleotide-diphosphate-sugar epimerase, membrane associated [Prochlorococcus marinus str. MIT 9515]|uniref:Nucleotide-diphosphate-sugar epimerase, membrane associated n=1 Tax=Prochlorococcus marinus (strain MIT 9515) TaxID=167542 RepID=A2BXR8_PROM5|nr:Nucleotide-diphosphate-sugar epimerase, membrane associated [Prochlorococcus marinus str. MIT 9515]
MNRFLFLKISYLLRYLLNLKIKHRKIYFICSDLILLTFSYISSLWLLDLSYNIRYKYFLFFLFFTSIYLIFGNYYKHLTRYSSSVGFYKLAIKNTLLIISIQIIFYLLGFYSYTFKFWLLLCFLSSSFTIALRVLVRDLITIFNISPRNNVSKIAIYGTGQNEVLLSQQILLTGSHNIVAFIDENPELENRDINGIKVKSLKQISNLDFDQLLVSTLSINSNQWLNILKQIKIIKPRIRILKIPSINSIEDGKDKIDFLKPISLEDLLFRKIVPPKENLLGPGIKDKVALVTGAAGSIGKELSLQILSLNPSKLVVVDFSEPNLFELKNILIKNNFQNKKIYCELGSTSDYKFMQNIFTKHNPDILFHASAYKHVTLLEENQIEAIKNNIKSTLNVCKLAYKFNTNKLILISSDKAVRPTSIMGVTKRISELIVSSYAQKCKNSIDKEKLVFSMVRFGNVLGSSGSVVPIFQKQIEDGGPVTVTDPSVTRYFMTLSEAASLVIQSSVLAKGEGEVFLLDMGKPMQIKKLAEQMILLNGLKIKNEENLDGDIEIVYRGLGSGEKLYEELLIDGKSQKTDHPLIFKAIEKSLDFDDLKGKLDNLFIHLKNNDNKKMIEILCEIIPEWLRE